MTETQTKLVNSKGQECDHDAVVGLMDNDIREQLHDRVSNDCSEQGRNREAYRPRLIWTRSEHKLYCPAVGFILMV